MGRPGATTIGLNGLGGLYNRYGAATPRSSGGFTVYRPEHWAFADTDLYYGDLLGGAPTFLVAFEVDSVAAGHTPSPGAPGAGCCGRGGVVPAIASVLVRGMLVVAGEVVEAVTAVYAVAGDLLEFAIGGRGARLAAVRRGRRVAVVVVDLVIMRGVSAVHSTAV
ncbi:hypothetical protein ACH4VM_38260 [Streptomyces sp. NPDC020792]|uniref:hypothetical protein n=1 Tax=Streptomyces sp. NPDC020792 TaxID=3365089 RepID=UPI00379BDC3F